MFRGGPLSATTFSHDSWGSSFYGMALIGVAPGKKVVGSAGIAMLVVIPKPDEMSEGM